MPDKYLDINGVKKIHDLVAQDINNHHDETKQDTLEFNPTIPSGVTPATLSAIKNGDNYYAPDGKQWAVITTSMTDAERKAITDAAELPYILLHHNTDGWNAIYYLYKVRGNNERFDFVHIDFSSDVSGNPIWYNWSYIPANGSLGSSSPGYKRVTDYMDQAKGIPSWQGIYNYAQTKLVSGTNIKTINGNTILGEGNLTIDTVTEARVQEMIDASINSAIGGKY